MNDKKTTSTTCESWFPIDSAPKWKEILMSNGEWVSISRLNEYKGKTYVESDNGDYFLNETKFSPTHWMPLPEPPKSQGI